MNEEIVTVIEASGLHQDLPPELPQFESIRLSAALVGYANDCGVKGPENFDPIREKAKGKYPTQGDRARVVLRALNILLRQAELGPINKRIVEKAKARLENNG